MYLANSINFNYFANTSWFEHRYEKASFVVPRLSRKQGILKLIRPSVCPSVCLSVTKTLTWLISSDVLMIEHWYLACMIVVSSPFNWYHAVTLTFELLQGQSCCRAGDHNSPNLLVISAVHVLAVVILEIPIWHCNVYLLLWAIDKRIVQKCTCQPFKVSFELNLFPTFMTKAVNPYLMLINSLSRILSPYKALHASLSLITLLTST